MKTFIIGGYSTKNKDWAYEVKKHIQDSEVIEWPHWSDPTYKFHARNETQTLAKHITNPDVNIIAKSIGTFVLMCFLEKFKVSGKIILNGIPYNDLNDDDKTSYKILSDYNPESIVVLQNSMDEHGSFEEARRLITGYNPNIKIVEKPGSTHDYPYYEEFEESLK